MTDKCVEHLRRLVGFDTVSCRSNSDLIEYAIEVLHANGIEAVSIPDASGEKFGLYATIGPLEAGGIVLSGHSDVVPVDGQEWSADPFVLTESGNRVYGRGATDMKGFLAVCLAMVPEMKRAPLKRPIHLVFSYDEETTCRGVVPVIQDMVETLPRIDAVIVGEPTGMQLVNAHKGAYGYTVSVTGCEAHSSLADQGVSANTIAARLIAWLDDQMRANAHRTRGRNGFEPSYSTCHAGTVRGGSACNILAGQCTFEWDLRVLPEDDPEQFLRAFKERTDEILDDTRHIASSSRVDIVEEYAVPGLQPETDGMAEAVYRRITGKHDSAVVSYSSEGGQFQAAGLSTVLVGPGSIEQAHIADEYIEKSQLAECERFIGRLIEYQAS